MGQHPEDLRVCPYTCINVSLIHVSQILPHEFECQYFFFFESRCSILSPETSCLDTILGGFLSFVQKNVGVVCKQCHYLIIIFHSHFLKFV